jgi:hypothetical protein
MRFLGSLTAASLAVVASGLPSLMMVPLRQSSLRTGIRGGHVTVTAFSDFGCTEQTSSTDSPDGCVAINNPTLALSDNQLPTGACGRKIPRDSFQLMLMVL